MTLPRTTWLLACCLIALSCTPPVDPMTDPCKGKKAGDLVLSEVMIDPDGTDTGGEWIEVFNTLGSPVDLRGYTLSYRQGSAAAKSHTIRASFSVPARGYVALGDVRSGPNPNWIAYTYGDDLGSFSQTSGTVTLKCGTVTLSEYTYTRAARSGRSRMLNGIAEPDGTQVANEVNWCDTPASTEYAPRNYGTPGGPNPQCAPESMVGTCIQNGMARPINPAEAGDLLITEVMASPNAVSDTLGEWIELFATTDVDLNGLSIGTSTTRTTLTSNDCLTVGAQTYNLLARSGDTFVNGGLPRPVTTFSISLAASNERLRLFRGDAGIDEAAFFSSDNGVSWQLRPEFLTMPDMIRLDVNDDPANFCKASKAWPDGGGDFGTPATPNADCATAPPDAGTPVDGGVTVNCANFMPGDLVVTEVMIDPTGTDTGLEWFELYNTTTNPIDLNGLVLTYRQGATAPRTHLVTQSVVVPPGQAVAVGDVRTGPNPAWIKYAYGAELGAFNNSAGAVGVRCGMNVINEYPWVRTARASRSRQLGGPMTPSAARVAVEANWCDTPVGNEYTPGATGTPGLPNPQCAPEAMTGTCLDNGTPRPIVAAEPGDLVITEVMTSPSVADSVGEWIEVYATTDLDLNGLSIANASGSRTTVSSMSCLRIGANTFGILARSSDTFVNGGLPAPVATYGTVGFASTNERVRLFRGDAGIDYTLFGPSSPAKSWQLPGELLTNPANITPAINDSVGAWCVAPLRYNPDAGSDFGSPSVTNPLCDGGVP